MASQKISGAVITAPINKEALRASIHAGFARARSRLNAENTPHAQAH